MPSWDERVARAAERYDDGAVRLPPDPDERQRQLTRMGNAAWAAGMSLLMLGDRGQARVWLVRSAERYRESWSDAPDESWGRPIGAMKARLIAGDEAGAHADARWALGAGAEESTSPIGRYAATLASLVLGDDAGAGRTSSRLRGEADFSEPVATALAAISAHEAGAYETAVRELLADFETRAAFLEDIPVADTVLVLQTLATARDLGVPLRSPLLPPM